MARYAGYEVVGAVEDTDLIKVKDLSDKTSGTKGSTKYASVSTVVGNATLANYDQTTRELGKAITPSDTRYPPGDIRRYGAVDGGADSTQAIQQAVDSTHNVYIPYGSFRVDGQVTLNQEVHVICEQGVYGSPTSWYYTDSYPTPPNKISVPVNNYCRLYKDNASQDTPFFNIGWREVLILGYPALCVKDKTSYTSNAINYTPGTANAWGYNGQPSIWGGQIEVYGVGNRTTIGNEGEGMTVVGIDWEGDGVQGYGYVSGQDIKIRCVNVKRAFDDPGVASGRNQWGNSLHISMRVDGAKQACRIKTLSGNWIDGIVQSRDQIHPNETGEAMCYIGTGSNYIDVKPWDLGSGAYSSPGNPADGQYRHAKFLENRGSGNTVISTISTAVRSNIGSMLRPNALGPLNAPRGMIPWLSRNSGLTNSGMVMAAFYDGLWCLEDRYTVTVSQYKGTDYPLDDVAVSDIVFSNKSGSTINITSALGELPTLVVKEKFTVSGHSEHFNNVKMTVTAVIANGYTVTAGGPGGGHSPNPKDAAAEAVTVELKHDAYTTNSATGGITVSTDHTLTRPETIFQLHGLYATFKANAQAVTDEDVIEIRATGISGVRMTELYTSLNSNGAFRQQQIITKTSGGDITDNVLINCASEADENPQDLNYFGLVGGAPYELIIRFIANRDSSKTGTFMGIHAMSENPESYSGYYVSKQGNQSVLNGFRVAGHLRLPTYTTARLEDATDSANTASYKTEGTVVFNTDTNKPVYATGSTDNSTWVDATGSTAHTPV